MLLFAVNVDIFTPSLQAQKKKKRSYVQGVNRSWIAISMQPGIKTYQSNSFDYDLSLSILLKKRMLD